MSTPALGGHDFLCGSIMTLMLLTVLQATLQLAEMARLGVQPDNIAATALINACARNQKMDMALSVFDELFGTLFILH